MSDLIIAAGVKCDSEAIVKSLSWTPQTRAWKQTSQDLTWIETRVDTPSLWAPAYDPVSKTCALIGGRIAPAEHEWKVAETLPYEGGLSCRIVIDRWLKGGAAAVEQLNGGAQIIIIDERRRELHVWTDRMGFFPAFAWIADGKFMLGSHPDVMAEALEGAGYILKFDAVTMAEFLETGTSVHPNTYWSGIRHMDSATHFEFDLGDKPRLRTSGPYWQPAYLCGTPYLTDRHEIVERLVAALTSAVRRRTLPILGKVGLLLSAGADSRTALFGACDPKAVKCYTFYDEINAEFSSAKRLAEAAQAEHVGYQRNHDYYVEHAPRTVRITGGMWSTESGHYTGLLDQLSGEHHGVVITGCYTDYLLKGLSFNRQHRRLLGRSLPIYTLAPVLPEFYQPFFRLESNWLYRVQKRLQERYASPIHPSAHPASLAEFLRLTPIVREADAAGRLLLRKTTPLDLFTADNDVVDLACRIHPEQKVSGVPFGMAVEKLTGPGASRILNNNYGARVGASEWQRIASFLKASALRKIRHQGTGQPFERKPNSVATVGSWPHYGSVIKFSGRLRDWRNNLAADQREFFLNILGAERLERSLDSWADTEPSLFFRLYTASLWLSQNSRTLSRTELT